MSALKRRNRIALAAMRKLAVVLPLDSETHELRNIRGVRVAGTEAHWHAVDQMQHIWWVAIVVATSDSWKDKQTGQQQERTEWHRVVFFGKLAEIVGQYFTCPSRSIRAAVNKLVNAAEMLLNPKDGADNQCRSHTDDATVTKRDHI